jgi:hypothetical protein
VESEREMGRWGNVDRACKLLETDREIVDAVVDGCVTDYVCMQLQERRGCDADRPLPEITRRDVIDAAVTAASGE